MYHDITRYLRMYDDYLTPEQCEEYIHLYEKTLDVEPDRVRSLSVCFNKNGQSLCGDCSCNRLNPMEYARFDHLNAIVLNRINFVLDVYANDVELSPVQWPETFAFEELRIKRFAIDGSGMTGNYHGLGEHVDVYSWAHAKRFLGMIIYLNDDFNGGETYFPLFDTKVTPKQGSIFIFPSDWTLSHKGNRPLPPSHHMAKYFLMTYACFPDTKYVNDVDSIKNRTEAQPDFNWDVHK